ncbi:MULTISPECIES: hypothetical protein [Bradyrhizobium]|uniref:hypothetical protein n=1 Tax=Bradyrhizobium elkanii TaxID=29448 RepID=UPI0012BB825A|nr:hypothetical protein [Bradyrhizobium elkanii]
MTTKAEMWKLYEFHGHRVQVVQQWRDPYGVWFVRIEGIDDETMADGMREVDFLNVARPL